MRFFTRSRIRRALVVPLAAAFGAASVIACATPAAAGTSSITGAAFDDANRNGTFDSGETSWADQQIYLFDAQGRNIAVTWTAATGAYAFTGLADGGYRVAYAAPSWAPVKMDWTPTTTGSWLPTRSVSLVSQARIDFGWRRIVRSTDVAQPIASYKAPNGLTVQMYNDAVAPEAVAQLVAQGSLVGEEAAAVTVRIDGSSVSATGSSYSSTGGTYTGYAAVSTIDWATWLAIGENALFHEYGHAWSGYYSVMVQQDPSLAGYLQARGLAGDARVDSSYGWSRFELIAEDYRQLFGTPTAQAGAQANGELPPAASVPGLRDYLATTLRKAPGSPTPPPPPPSSLSVTGLAVTPKPLTKTGTVSYSLDQQAAVTVTIRTPSGAPVRTLASGVTQGAGAQQVTWDRRDAKGRRVAAGTYVVSVTASASGVTTNAMLDFPVACVAADPPELPLRRVRSPIRGPADAPVRGY